MTLCHGWLKNLMQWIPYLLYFFKFIILFWLWIYYLNLEKFGLYLNIEHFNSKPGSKSKFDWKFSSSINFNLAKEMRKAFVKNDKFSGPWMIKKWWKERINRVVTKKWGRERISGGIESKTKYGNENSNLFIININYINV